MALVHGFSDLTEEFQKEVTDEMSKTDAIKLASIDPNDPDFMKKNDLTPVKAPPQVLRPLLPYQEEGFGWMLRQEQDDDVRGGILVGSSVCFRSSNGQSSH